TRTVDSDERKRNTAFTPFGRDIERDGNKFNDEKIIDPDVRAGKHNDGSSRDGISSRTIQEDSERIYTSEVRREDQHGKQGSANRSKDSRLDGENIHPTTDAK